MEIYKQKAIIKDVNKKPVPQYWNPITQQYEVVESKDGMLRVNMVDSEGREIQSQNLIDQISSKLDELIEAVPSKNLEEKYNHNTELLRYLSGGGVEGLGRNYFNPNLVNNLALSDVIVENNSYRGYVLPVNEGEVYSISRTSLINNRFRYVFTVDEPVRGIEYFGGTGNSTLYDNDFRIENIIVPENANYLFLYLSNSNDELPNVKIEKGAISTPWTPALENIQ